MQSDAQGVGLASMYVCSIEVKDKNICLTCSLIHSFIQMPFIECQLHSGHRARYRVHKVYLSIDRETDHKTSSKRDEEPSMLSIEEGVRVGNGQGVQKRKATHKN